MAYSEMLHDLLEGSLPSAREETLFRALAADDDLRFEFKSLLKMRDAVRDDDRAVAVPISSTTQIFSQLGYLAPGLGAGAVGGSGVATFLRSFGTHATAVVVGIILASSWFLWIDGGHQQEANLAATLPAISHTLLPKLLGDGVRNGVKSGAGDGVNNGVPPSQRPEAGGGFAKSSAPAVASARLPRAPQSTAIDAAADGGQHGNQHGNQTVASANTNDADGGSTSIAPASALLRNQSPQPLGDGARAITPAELRAAPDTVGLSNSAGSVSLETPALLSSSAVAPAATGRSFRPDFRLGLRAVAPMHLAQPTQPLPTGDGLNNVAASLVVRGFSQNFAAVLEAGRESYIQKFDQLKSDGRIFHVEQAPSVLWGGIGVRYSLNPESTFSPFVQGLVGGSEAGPIVRSMIGLDWQFSRSAGLTLGVDYSALSFAFQDRTWYSQRVGVGGGLTFRLIED
ncbi:MAG: hypothetical protein IPM61_07760 [Chlorobi bacterium]|nr:MAG: hypothetical protein UZ07_CHB004002665 [Chlorobi bacterium OLB7]MBK8911213.1 hypothetical protein [Chlorobiota bacterium]